MKLKYFELDKEELNLLEEYEKGEWIPEKDQAKARKQLMEAAKNTLNKIKNINIRISERDLQRLKSKAAKQGIPYQTLVASLIHQSTAE